jgi:hypothetical protein
MVNNAKRQMFVIIFPGMLSGGGGHKKYLFFHRREWCFCHFRAWQAFGIF